MRLHPKITQDAILAAVEADDNIGFCTSCGEENEGVEPDARAIRCDVCGRRAVYGAEELLVEVTL